MFHTFFDQFSFVFNFLLIRGHIPPEMLEIAFIFVDTCLSTLPVSARKKERIFIGNGLILWGESHWGRLKCTNTMAHKNMFPLRCDWISHLSALFLLRYQILYCVWMLWITIPFSIKNKGSPQLAFLLCLSLNSVRFPHPPSSFSPKPSPT